MSDVDIEVNSVEKEYVGFWDRFGASLVDSIILLAITSPLLYLIYGSYYWESEALILGVSDFLITWIFPLIGTILFWTYKSATPGKMFVKAIVVDAKTGQPISAKQSVIRYIGYYISLLPFGLGFFCVAWDAKKQGWHDKLAGTAVIRPS